ncbi:MAG: DUF1343 domain-containing protein [Clostridia bacterium]|nr:DUF1343 domain-containing protein [Clostridia bacterium]
MKKHILSGIDRIDTVSHLLKGRRVGLMTNPTGINHQLQSTVDLLHSRFGLSALYAVEHGIRGDIQAGEHVESFVDPETGVPVYSAYGPSSRFTDEMLDAFDVLVFDIQDMGARFYTYIYSMGYALEACARAGKSMIVLDRVNPLGGIKRCGTILRPGFASFVGDYALPTQYGLTVGELAGYVKHFLQLDVDLTVVPLQGWTRDTLLDETDLPWVAPSPNLTNLEGALCYIGTCVFEGTNLSEGRGTTLPFQVMGAPFLDGAELERRMNALQLPGLHFRRTSFCPTFSKHQGVLCHGVQMHVTDRDRCNAFAGGLFLLQTARELAGEAFAWLGEKDFFIDKLLGTDELRTGRYDAAGLVQAYLEPVRAFGEQVKPYELYR